MREVRDAIQPHLLVGKHRALVSEVDGTNQVIVSTPGNGVRMSFGSAAIVITYTGVHFKITEASPSVFVNNNVSLANSILPDSCVITFEGPPRKFYLFDVSHPEVVL